MKKNKEKKLELVYIRKNVYLRKADNPDIIKKYDKKFAKLMQIIKKIGYEKLKEYNQEWSKEIHNF
jgi:accessory colonization factor AcfC